MSLRDRLEAKQRRRVDVPILVSDPAEDTEALMRLHVALGVARDRESAEAVATLERDVEAATEKVRGNWAMVTLQSLARADWEAAMSEHQIETGTDWPAALPILLAASAVDPELQDEQWWTGRLTGDAWSEGDVDALRLALLRLNVEAAAPQVPKG